MPVGGVVKCKQRARPTVSPFLSRHHVAFTLAKTARGFQETVIPAHVQLIAIVRQFQRLVRVLFSFHQLLDTLQLKLLKGKGVLGHVSVEGGRFHQSHQDEVGGPVVKRVVDFFQAFRGRQIVGPHFASHGGVTHNLLGHGQGQVSVQVFVQFHLTQQQFDLDVVHVESQGVRASVADGEEIGRVEEELNAHLDAGHQQFAEMKHLDHGFEPHHVRLVHVLTVFFSHLFQGKSFRFGQGRVIGMGHVQLTVGPALGFQDGLSIVSVKVDQGVQDGLVGVRIRLGTDQGVVQPHANLFEERVGQVVGQEDLRGGGGRQGRAVGFLEFQFQFKFALTQIDVFRLGFDLKIHRRDARGEGMHGHLATIHDAEIRRGYLEQIHHGIDDGCGTRQDGRPTHDDDVVAGRESHRMTLTRVPMPLLTPSPSLASLGQSFLQSSRQVHAGHEGQSAPQGPAALTQSARIDGCHSTTQRGP